MAHVGAPGQGPTLSWLCEGSETKARRGLCPGPAGALRPQTPVSFERWPAGANEALTKAESASLLNTLPDSRVSGASGPSRLATEHATGFKCRWLGGRAPRLAYVATGSSIRTANPLGCAFAALIRPPCSSTARWLIASPSPAPPVLRARA